jgi:hypothetical protein
MNNIIRPANFKASPSASSFMNSNVTNKLSKMGGKRNRKNRIKKGGTNGAKLPMNQNNDDIYSLMEEGFEKSQNGDLPIDNDDMYNRMEEGMEEGMNQGMGTSSEKDDDMYNRMEEGMNEDMGTSSEKDDDMYNHMEEGMGTSSEKDDDMYNHMEEGTGTSSEKDDDDAYGISGGSRKRRNKKKRLNKTRKGYKSKRTKKIHKKGKHKQNKKVTKKYTN